MSSEGNGNMARNKFFMYFSNIKEAIVFRQMVHFYLRPGTVFLKIGYYLIITLFIGKL